jgi:signal transduction histidine kinase
MRERADELGGTCVIETNKEGGVRVVMRLPLAAGLSRDTKEVI